MPQPTLRQIQAFKAFVETGTVSKAADLLFVSQPAVSKLLTHIEEDTGLHLLDRTRGKINVTERGMRLYEEIDRIFTGVDQIGHAVEIIRKEDRGHLTIGLMPSTPSNIVARATKNFMQIHPDVYLSFNVRSSQFIVDAVLARQLDIGIVLKRLDHDQFISTPFDDSALIVAVPVRHKLASKRVLNLKELSSEPMIAFIKGSASRHVLERALLSHNLDVNVVLEATTAIMALELVSAGLGVSVMHPMSVSPSVKGVKIIRLKERLSLPIYVVRAKNSRRDNLIDDFLALYNDSLNHHSLRKG